MVASGDKLVTVISGPCCSGKSTLMESLPLLDNVSQLQELNLIKSKASRADGPRNDTEKKQWNDITYFREENDFEYMYQADQTRYVQMHVHGHPVALDLDRILQSGFRHLYVESPYDYVEGIRNGIAKRLSELPHSNLVSAQLNIISVFISPFSQSELLVLQNDERERYIKKEITKRLCRRTEFEHFLKNELNGISDQELCSITRRAVSAYPEMMAAHRFNHVLHNRFNPEAYYSWCRTVPDSCRNFKRYIQEMPGQLECWEALSHLHKIVLGYGSGLGERWNQNILG